MSTPRQDATRDRIEAELVDPLQAMDLDVEAVEVTPAGKRRVLRVAVDKDGGVTLDDVADATREVERVLDESDVMGEMPYTLEVTSPGVDRPLTVQRHWRRAHLRLVTVRPQVGSALGDAVFAGRVGTAGEESVTLLVDGRLREVRYADVAHAAVEVEFAPPPTKEIALLDPGAIEEEDSQ